MLILLTGPQHAGKTTACWRALPSLRAAGVRFAGFVSPPLLNENGAKTGIEMVDLTTGARQTFARVVKPGERADVGRYRMVPSATGWARDVLSAALLANADWLVVDEIGPLELRNGGGFAFALAALADPLRVPNAIVIVRDSLVGPLSERLGRSDMVLLPIAEATRAVGSSRLAQMITGKPGING